ncbi:hypothetical protein TIFTF001_024040 [Ficus carica]|uniref:RNase H type-1 domain-containing protein n=1 Tax=Ficus carica TaxID=3494 RepID=A0AA88AXM3_FICCA|nr:hypothetical protein TIFTF001_024040 [Ficus carica]
MADLIQNRQWDCELISQSFLSMDSDVILSIPLGRSNCHDNLIWHYDSCGLYTMHSGYWVAMEAKGLDDSSNAAVSKAWWGKLWSLKLPSKCCEGVESVRHSLWECPSIGEFSEKVSREELVFLTSMAWAIWRTRDMWVHSNHVIDARSVMEMACTMLGDLQQCLRLEVPVEEVGIVAIIRDSEGMVVAGFARHIEIAETDAVHLASERSKWSGSHPYYLST